MVDHGNNLSKQSSNWPPFFPQQLCLQERWPKGRIGALEFGWSEQNFTQKLWIDPQTSTNMFSATSQPFAPGHIQFLLFPKPVFVKLRLISQGMRLQCSSHPLLAPTTILAVAVPTRNRRVALLFSTSYFQKIRPSLRLGFYQLLGVQVLSYGSIILPILLTLPML